MGILLFLFIHLADGSQTQCACCGVEHEIKKIEVSPLPLFAVGRTVSLVGDVLEGYDLEGVQLGSLWHPKARTEEGPSPRTQELREGFSKIKNAESGRTFLDLDSWWPVVGSSLKLTALKPLKPCPIFLRNDKELALFSFFQKDLKSEIVFEEWDPSVLLCPLKGKAQSATCNYKHVSWKIESCLEGPDGTPVAIVREFEEGSCPKSHLREHIVALGPKKRRAAVSYLLGQRAFDRKKFKEAIRRFEESLDGNPQFKLPLYSLSRLLAEERHPFSEGADYLKKWLPNRETAGRRPSYLEKLKEKGFSFWQQDPEFQKWLVSVE